MDEDISIILNTIISSDEFELELSIDQLISYLNINQAYIDEIIEGLSSFFRNQTVEDVYFYKILNIFCENLEEKNLSQINFINNIFPLLMDKIYNYKTRKQKEENILFNTISDFVRKLGNNVTQIEQNMNKIFEKLTSDDTEINDINKYALLVVLTNFLRNSPNVSFFKIMKSQNDFKKIVTHFKHKNKLIRKSVKKLIEEFLIILFNKEDDLRMEQTEKIIYNVCIKDYLDVPNISDFCKHGLILVLNALAVTNPKNPNQINEFFKNKSKIFLEYLCENLSYENPLIKISIIKALTDYCELLPKLLEKKEQEYYFQKILDDLVSLSNEEEIEEKINSEIIKAFGKLNLIPEYQFLFDNKIDSILLLIEREISSCQTFNENILNCLSDLMANYPDKFIDIFSFDIYYEKLFNNGLKEIHVKFVQKLLNLHQKNSKESIKIIICILNVISFIIIQKPFNFKFSQKLLQIISKDSKEEHKNSLSKCDININSISDDYLISESGDILNLVKTISAPLKNQFSNIDLQRYNKIGKIIKDYMKDIQQNKIKYSNEINKAITLLGYINNENFGKDILHFYIENCVKSLENKERETKILIISLGNSPWIPRSDNKNNYLKLIFENFMEYLINEISDEDIILSILKTIEDKRYLQFLVNNNFYLKYVFSLTQNDSNKIKKKTVEIISKLIPYNYENINFYIKEKLKKIFLYLDTSNIQYKKEKCVILLSYLIQFANKCIENEIETILKNLLRILKKEINNEDNKADKLKNENNILILNILSAISELMNNQNYDKTQLNIYMDDIMSICIRLLREFASTPLNEEMILCTILSVLTNSNKEWKIYFDYIDLVSSVIDIISKSQNKTSRLYAIRIFGHIGTINPDKLEILLDLNEVQNENNLDDFLIADEINNFSDTEIVYQKDKIMKGAKNQKDKKLINKLNVSQSILSIEKGEFKFNFDFKKAIREKSLNNITYYAIHYLMKILLNNSNYNLNINIFKFLKEAITIFQESDYPIIYLILPTLLYLIENFEENAKIIILEIINFIIKTYIAQSQPFTKNIMKYIINELNKSKKNYKSISEKNLKYLYLSIIEDLCTLYDEEISDYYQKIIPLILSLLSEKEEISIESKRKVISCLNHIGNHLSNYLSLVIPRLISYMNSLIFKISLSSKDLKKKLDKPKKNEFWNFFSSLFFKDDNSNDINNNIEIKKQIDKAETYEEKEEKELLKDILNLIYFLLDKPGILNYMEKIIHTLCYYMEVEPNSSNFIFKIFIKMLNNFKKEFLFFFPYIIKICKKIPISLIPYLNEFKKGLENNKIIDLINNNNNYSNNKKDYNFKFFQNETNIDNYLNEEITNSNKIELREKSKTSKNIKNISFHSDSERIFSSEFKIDNINDKSKKIKNKLISRNIQFESLIKELETKYFSNEDDWHEWFKSSSMKLFANSPSNTLYLCYKYNVCDSHFVEQLYNSAFYSLWISCPENLKLKIIKNLREILNNPKTPDDILLIILNLIEFISKEENEHIEIIGFDKLAEIANVCEAHAKALYYAENDYMNNDSSEGLKKLINLYIDLELPESALGIYRLAKKKSKISFNNLLKEKNLLFLLHQWKKALKKIEEHQKIDKNGKFIYDLNDNNDKSLLIKKALCFEGLSDWENLLAIGDDLIKIEDKNEENIIDEKNDNFKIDIPSVLSKAALNLGKWDELRKYSAKIKSYDDDIYEENFFKAIISIKDAEYEKAEKFIDIARDSIDDKIKILLNESYKRAHNLLLDSENLCQLEDIINLKKQNYNKDEYNKKKENLKILWNECLGLKKEDIKAFQRMIGIRGIIFTPEEDYLTSLELAQICRKKDRFTTCMIVLNQLQKNLKNCEADIKARVGLALAKCNHDDNDEPNNLDKAIKELENIFKFDMDKLQEKLKSKIYCYYGMWRAEKIEKNLNENDVNCILKDLKLSTEFNKNNYKAWHSYALLNYRFFEYIKKIKNYFLYDYAANALEGFIKSICIGDKNTSIILQDLLLLLNIWFQTGVEQSINNIMIKGIDDIPLKNWILVIPQLLTRINVENPLIKKSLISLLKKIVQKFPRSLTYPLTVLKLSKSNTKVQSISLILENLKKEHEQIFQECELIINELNRCALFLHEKWRETIEESAKLFFQSKDFKGGAKLLTELHKKMKNKPKTPIEINFYHEYIGELNEAYLLLQDYLNKNNFTSFNEAWNIYHSCFESISINYRDIEYINMKNVSKELSNFRESQIEIPGIYQNGLTVEEDSVIKISSFSQNIIVFKSKQHPRKIVMYGNDGKDYPFLLKGHDDLRQDERVMQLFRLINTLLSKDSDTKEKNLYIKRYPVIPLSHNTGLIGWLSNCDTLNQLIKEYRQMNNISLNTEYNLITNFAPGFDSSTCMTKLEAFKHSLNMTLGIDLYKIIWNKSQNAENWLDIRTNYSHSLAVMSIVGYILGLGDRHPSNIMLDRTSGKIIHTDFADCFEVAMKRDKFPEKIPFRLTRMLIKALEVGGIEGTFRITCENIMRVMRENKDSLNVILAAFVHDPLTSLRLLIPFKIKNTKNKKGANEKIMNRKEILDDIINDNKKLNKLEKKRVESNEWQLYYELEEKNDINSDDLNEIVKQVLERVSDKLNGSDFNKNEELKINVQVQRLIKQATSHENLSQSYLGWCPFW